MPSVTSTSTSSAAVARPVLLAFLLSGLAGLMHQVVWSKLLVGLIGATAHAQAAVLAVFMGGLALGAAAFGRSADRRGRPLRTYIVLEVLIAVYCLLLPLLLAVASRVYVGLAGQVFESASLKLMLRLGLATVTVLLPAVMMGGTLPVLARYLIGDAEQTRRQVAHLYGLNSLGAVLGAGLAGFITLPLLGVHASLVIASLLNLAAAAIVLGPAKREESSADPKPSPQPDLAANIARDGVAPVVTYGPRQYVLSLAALFLSGFAAMGYEVLFIRIIALSFGLSVHSFTVMLMCFITGIGLGSLIAAKVRAQRPLWLLALSQLAVVVALLAATPLVSRLPYLVTLIRIETFGTPFGFLTYHLGKALLCLLILLVPTTCLGLAFPLVAHVQARRSPRIASLVGSTYAWNTVGNVVGTVVTSLLLLPAIGVLGAFHVNVALSLAAGLFLLVAAAEAAPARRMAAAGATLAVAGVYLLAGTAWLDPINLGMNHLRVNRRVAATDGADPTRSFAAWKEAFVADRAKASSFHFDEDAHATILVYGDASEIALYVNTKPDASTNRDLPAQMFLAHCPLMMNTEARDVLVIGHGSGITAGSALRHPVERLDIVEISRAVLGADYKFMDFNEHALADPRVHVYEDDGQSFLRVVPRSYDVIISEPSNPWIAGIGGLFTVEFFECMRAKLNPGGLATIWFHEYEQSVESVQLVMRTIRAVFPHVLLFRSPEYMDIIVVASAEPIAVDFAAMEERYDQLAVRNDLARLRIVNLASFLMHHSLSGERLATLLPPGPLNTSGHQRLEYLAPRTFFAGIDSDFVRRNDALFNGRALDGDMLLARYRDFRNTVGEPLSREEIGQAIAVAEFMGFGSKLVAATLRSQAESYPAAGRQPSRPARGRVPLPAECGLYEASYWEQRFRSEGNAGAARGYARRLDELIQALAPPAASSR